MTVYSVYFEVPGEPRGKGRGRAVRTGRGVRVVTPQDTRVYEALVTDRAMQAWGDRPPMSGPLLVEITMVHRRPAGLFRRGDSAARIWRARKPDVDNIVKAVLDGVQAAGIWSDDAQVVMLVARQYDGAIVDRGGRVSEAPYVGVLITAAPEVHDA